ncbi:unnamed protein product [Lymnaea stagnalis]|uniref:MIP18 family-like domain-containing protein n=1 Tax=Lymnaea stagnalis TaxID=6523 RepID=A0AAV2H177_LYMST
MQEYENDYDSRSVGSVGTDEVEEAKKNDDTEIKLLQETIFDLVSRIRDPEKPDSLEDLNVISESGIKVCRLRTGQLLVRIEFVPTVPHCNLASIIGLSMRSKLEKCLPDKIKVDIFIKEGTHETADEINKQINDKERISAAMENPNLQRLVNECIDNDET